MKHGTVAMYTTGGCRLTCCKTAKARYDKRRNLRAVTGPVSMPAIGARRRLQALRAIGWPLDDVAQQAGYVGLGSIADIAYGNRKRLTVARWQRIADVYDRLCMTPGPSEQARQTAARNGWPPPLAWPEGGIDDPTARPTGVRREVAA